MATAATERVLGRLDELYRIGGGPGANRPGLSAAEQEAHDLVRGWMEQAGLETSVDGAGNLMGRLRGARPELPEVWTGSHLDTVPNGGRYDGALGVVAGLEAVDRAGRRERTLAVVAFRDEEGGAYLPGCFGSRSLCGLLAEGGPEVAPDAPPPLPGAFVEAHIEQGPVLALAGAPLGVVTTVVGVARGTAVFTGRIGHAGTTPMAGRADALCAAAEFVLRVRDAAASVEGAVATVGQVEVQPGAVNVIPGRASVSVDARAPERGKLDKVVRTLNEAAAARGGTLELAPTDPVPMAPEPTEALREEVRALALPLVELPSGAGHDAAILAAAGVPSAMLFVRSLAGGISHSPEEHSDAADIGLCVEVLAGALARLAEGK